jgi:hypothetical protein
MIAYKEVISEFGTVTIVAETDGYISYIPIDPANSDYQAYLAWLEDPNAETTPPIL